MVTKTAKKPKLPPNAFKHRATTVEFETRAKAMLRKALEEQGFTHGALSAELEGISEAALTNKISRGGFSAAFLLQCMDVLGLELVAKPKRG